MIFKLLSSTLTNSRVFRSSKSYADALYKCINLQVYNLKKVVYL